MAALVHLAPDSVFAGDFRVLRPLSEGGMGAVYVVEQLSTGKQRALKIMHPHFVVDPRSRQRFALEARVGGQINSEHVVEVVGAGIDSASGTPWLAMELLDGEDLASVVTKRGRIPALELREIVEQVGHALGAAHAAGVVHLDLKPENIFLASSRRHGARSVVKLLDFGIARLLQDSRSAATVTSATGTPYWMAPEQGNRGAHVRPATDVWALGLIAFHLLTGQYYWRAANAADATFSLSALLVEVMVEPIEPASTRAAELGCADVLPPGFDAWFARCVARDPTQRFVDGGIAMAALANVLTGASASPALATTVEAPRFEAPPAPVAQPMPSPPPAAPQLSMAPTHMQLVSPSLAHLSAAPLEPTMFMSITAAPLPPAPPVSTSRSTPVAAIVAGVALCITVGAGGLWWRSRDSAPVASASATSPARPVAPVTPLPPICPDGMLAVTADTFTMGSPAGEGDDDERPSHIVTLSGFCIDRTEVTVAHYRACVAAGRCAPPDHTSNATRTDLDTHPVNRVSWAEASAYCAQANARLPTEAEWEYAARGKDARRYPWGNELPDRTRLNMATPADGWELTAPVGTYPAGASPTGALDLAGNVWEWVSDWNGPYDPSARTDPEGAATGDRRIIRGGAWDDTDVMRVRAANRDALRPETRAYELGFRCVRR